MAKAFTEEERIKIKEDLKKVGEEIFSKYGLKKTSIGDITEAVGIGKGSFYSFYPSKELLFVDILAEINSEIKIIIKDYIQNDLKIKKGEVYKMFKMIFHFIHSRPLYIKFFSDSENLYALRRKLPKDFMENCSQKEQMPFIQLMSVLKKKGLVREEIDDELALGILKSINLTYLNRDFIGENILKDVLDAKLFMFAEWLEKEDLK